MASSIEVWRVAHRSRLVNLASAEHAGTFLIGMPGTGRTTLLRHMLALLEEEGTPTHWCASREEISAAHEPGTAIFVDDLIVSGDDPLWEHLRSVSGVRVFVAAISAPAWVYERKPEQRLLRARDLAFSEHELGVVLALNASVDTPQLREQLLGPLVGHPQSVRLAVEEHRDGAYAEGWTISHAAASAALVIQELRRFDGADLAKSDIVRVLRGLSLLRRFNREDVQRVLPDFHADRWFDEVVESPYGWTQINPVTRDLDFVWHGDTFERLTTMHSAQELRAACTAAMAHLPGDGNVLQRLYLALRARTWGEVEAIAQRHFRTVYEYAPKETVDEMLQAPSSVLPRLPSTQLLTALFKWRKFGATRAVLHSLRESSLATTRVSASDPVGAFSQITRRALAAAFGGDRTSTQRCIAEARSALRGHDASLNDELFGSASARGRFAADCLVFVWAATQVDELPFALELAQLASEYGESFNRTDRDARRNVEVIGVVAGVRQTNLEKLTGHRLPGYADCFDLLDEGDEPKAVELARSLRNLPRAVLPHDAAASIRFMIEALAGDEDPIAEMDSLLEASAASWRDGLPSTLLALAATTFYLTRGQNARAQKTADYAGAEGDCYISIARALVELSNGRPGEALLHADAALADAQLAPRYASIARTLAAISMLRLGNTDAAANRVATMATQCLDDRNARFALRFATHSDIALFGSISVKLPQRITMLLELSKADSRPLSDATVGEELSSAEIDVLRLVGRNWTNAQIAAQRFVSVHTVRAQLRSVFRKLGATDRRSAVAAAERRGLLE